MYVRGIRINIIWTVLIVLVLIYVVVLLWVLRSPKAKELNLSLRGLIVVYTTQRGKGAMDRVGSYRRFCSGLAVFSKVVSAVLMLIMVFLMLVAAYNIPSVIKGSTASAVGTGGFELNMVHFLVFGVIALIIAMVIHEFAHGVQSRANDVRVEQSGLMYAVVPLGAFVEMNKEDSDKASLKSRMSIYSAGVASNFIVAVIAFVVLAGLMLAPLGNASDIHDDSAGVYAVSSNFGSVIPVGAVITHVDGDEVYIMDSGSDKILTIDSKYSNDKYTIKYLTRDGEGTIDDFRLGLYVDFVAKNSPAHVAGMVSNSIITNIQVNGEDTKMFGIESFRDFIAGSSPGDEATISYFDDKNEGKTATVTLGQNGVVGYIGVGVNYSGMSFIAPKDVIGTAMNPIYGQTTVIGGVLSMISYPFISLSGFSPMPEAFQWWFDAPGGEIFWLLAAFIYWMFWVNFLLGVTNALPAIPFDGGFLFKGWVTQLLNKISYRDQETREKIADNVTRAVSGFMLFLLALIIFVIILY